MCLPSFSFYCNGAFMSNTMQVLLIETEAQLERITNDLVVSGVFFTADHQMVEGVDLSHATTYPELQVIDVLIPSTT